MINLTFITGAGLRRVRIDKRQVTFMTSELGDAPLIINLDKLDEPVMQKRIKDMNVDTATLKELSLLKTEEQLKKDIVKDFQKNGWRLYNK